MISLCITTYNRYELLFESFAQVLDDDRISEIVIVDDCSDGDIWNKICVRVGELNWKHPKIKLYRNEKNLGCYHNKREAVSKASNEWVIIFDSDNIIDKTYIDKIFECNKAPYAWSSDTIYQPAFARPHFDFRKFQLETYERSNVHLYAGDPTFTTALNAMNYFVNRDEFLKVFEDRPEPWTADSLLQNYNWLKAGNSIYFCPGLEYEHLVHDGSHYKEHHRKTGNLYNELVNKLKEMR
jgi:glycosyltransferase involved in cell wall biosynthesis